MQKLNFKVIYTDDLPEWVGGNCSFPNFFPYFGFGQCIIKIKHKYKFDIGLLNHEKEHVKQYSNNWFHTLKYKFNKKYRLACELEAYTKQVIEYRYTNITQVEWIIKALENKYDLELTREQIREILINKFSVVFSDNSKTKL